MNDDKMTEQIKQIMNLTIGSVIVYLENPKFSDFTEKEKDILFNRFVKIWENLLPEKASMLWKSILLDNAVDTNDRKIFNKTKEDIFKSIGWQ
jgi:hypothetical protein